MSNQPLAERLRPKTLDDYIGQEHLVGKGAVIRRMIESGSVSSFILWGPPGCGKTTLARLLADKPAKINLIPFNPFAGNEFERSPADTIRRFQNRLRDHGLVATTRKTRGEDIDAACGQLAGKVSDRVRNRLSEKRRRMATA